MYVHYTYEPTGPWWKLTKPLVKEILHPYRSIFFGHKFELGEHRCGMHVSTLYAPPNTLMPSSDVMRLLILERYGGVYIDHDTMVLRSFVRLYHHNFVIMNEGGE